MRKIPAIFLLALAALTSYAQQDKGSIKGNVTFNDGKPAPFIALYLKVSGISGSTDEKGNFILEAPLGRDTLILQGLQINTLEFPVVISKNSLALNPTVEESVSSLNEVVISASRNKESLEEVPSSVTIITPQELQVSQLIASDIVTILESRVPGLGASSNTSSNWGQTLRGRPMLIMIDGVPQSTPLRNGAVDMRSIDPAIIERVEVIKGATAVYGNGAAGGLINYITKNPKKGFASHSSMGMTGSLVDIKNSVGARLSQQFTGSIGDLDYVISGTFEQTGVQKDAEGDVLPPTYGLGETDSYNGFMKLRYNFNKNHRVQFSLNHYSSEQKTSYIPVYGNYEDRVKTKAVIGEIEGDPQGVRGNTNLNLQFSGNNLFLNSTYNVDLYYQNVDNVFFYSPVFAGGGQSMISSEKKGLRFVFNTPYKFRKIVTELTYGVDLLEDVTSQPLVDGRIWVPEMDMSGLAPFVQVKMNLSESLIFKGGFRMERVNIAVEDYTTLETVNFVTGGINPGFEVSGGELAYNAYLFNAGLRYNKYDLFTPYLSFSQGFSVSDIGLMLRSAQVDDINKINTDAIVINNYEAGFVSKFKTVRFESVGYISTSELGSSGHFENGVFEMLRSPEKIYGFEAIGDITITKNLSVGSSYSWVEGKRDIDDNGIFTDEEDVFLGGERISAPKVTAFAIYSLFDEKLSLNLQYTGIRDRIRFERNETDTYNVYQGPVEGYNLVNLLIGYNFNTQTSAHLGIENLLNQDYFPARAQWFTYPTLYNKGKGTSFKFTLTHRI